MVYDKLCYVNHAFYDTRFLSEIQVVSYGNKKRLVITKITNRKNYLILKKYVFFVSYFIGY